MKIQSTETVLRGEWAIMNGRTFPDATCERIQDLLNAHLQKVGQSRDGWETLYRDPHDGRLWELCFPLSESHGGGPPSLRYLTAHEVSEKYPDITLH
jgi:hypothetical protein